MFPVLPPRIARHTTAICGLFFIVLAGITPGLAHAASFDCSKAQSAVEQAICANTDLSALDTQIAGAYSDSLQYLPENQIPTLRQEQRNWLAQRNHCASPDLTACLTQQMNTRSRALLKLALQGQSELGEVIQQIPANPELAAQRLRTWHNPLAAAWLVWLHQFAPESGVSEKEAQRAHDIAANSLKDDSFSWSVLTDVEKDPKQSNSSKTLLLLRMVIERLDRSSPVLMNSHCFIFARLGGPAWDAFGPLYGSSRDAGAPVCSPRGDLFTHPAWQALEKAFSPALEKASSDAGTIQFATYAAWRVQALKATVSPSDFLTPATLAKGQKEPEVALKQWSQPQLFSATERQAALQAMKPAQQQTAAWLVSARGMLPEQAQRAAHEIVRQWVLDRISFIDGSDFSPEN